MTFKLAIGVATLAGAVRYALKDAVAGGALTVFVTSFLGLYVATKMYRLFVYPFYFSPLRNLPRPTVCPRAAISRHPSSLTCRAAQT